MVRGEGEVKDFQATSGRVRSTREKARVGKGFTCVRRVEHICV
ncbi:hypothetical protein SLEP1_g30394 [Rubroshorea leprosula]|uniref:Uncharacterized protein n=1 Tax=Rubroshorea leprosula TaxID=152421 RepID=A0AAV5K7M3_9ROSI|nr:hypothetical protein SLEP1_g30394 [Rubroshorea leprosula]